MVVVSHDVKIIEPRMVTSGFFAPFNLVGQTRAVNQALIELNFALKKAATAADETFLVKPVNDPLPQALGSSRLLVVHNDAAAKAAAHLRLAIKELKPYQTEGPDGIRLEKESSMGSLFCTSEPFRIKASFKDFI
jgi:hypothetical protein